MPSLAKVVWLWFLLTLGGVFNSEMDIEASIFSANLPLTSGPGERAETVALLFCFEGVTISGMTKLALAAEGGEVRTEVFRVVLGAVDPLLGVPGPEYDEGGAGDVTGLGWPFSSKIWLAASSLRGRRVDLSRRALGRLEGRGAGGREYSFFGAIAANSACASSTTSVI
jgi:hypothetical protein